MWVRVPDWMLVESGRPRPEVDSLFPSAGVRLHGQITAVDGHTPDGICEVTRFESTERTPVVYALTGTAAAAVDVWTGDEDSNHHQRAGAELVLSVDSDRFQVQFKGSASTVTPNSRLTATGELVLVGDYEWDAFDLTDTRADWRVMRVVDLARGAVLVELQRSAR
ncbi:hypothetical protein [Nocardioides nematodiphilus]|uniref:hypothetical protein n=1 Tax=Nocardioides nematodiphilus TaxID=2849669 RepID=UPI001CDA47C8|nr:hypothetical protein [Nocardioides nematodiphilus]MCA1984736.1 hypothetical protein [Nocardioides nematodiphilus]